MIICIDGVNGVGKSHVANELEKCMFNYNAIHIDSDLHWQNFLKKDMLKAFSGFNPYNNKYFLDEFRKMLDEEIYDFKRTPLISLSIVDRICKKEFLDYFQEKNENVIHIILKAKEETILKRIDNDPFRDKEAKSQQKKNVIWQMRYLENEYPDAIWIDTEGKSLKEIVDLIILAIK